MENFPVTVVIPAYKSEKYIYEAVKSIRSQDCPSKIIVVEDGIYDNTKSALYPFNENLTHIQLNENKGAPYARNVGLSLVDTEYVMFLDSDDFIEGDLLLSLFEALELKKASLAFGPCKLYFEASGRYKLLKFPEKESEFDVLCRWLYGFSGPGTCSILWRTSEIRRIGGWNEKIARNQDGELIVRALLNNCTIAKCFNGVGVYRKTNHSSVSKTRTLEAFDSQKYIESYVEFIINHNKYTQNKYKIKKLKKALNRFRMIKSMTAYDAGLDEIGREWEVKWKRNGGYIAYRGRKITSIILSLVFYQLFGLKKGQKIMNKLRSLFHNFFY